MEATIQKPQQIILLDLNYTLVENSHQLGYPQYENLHREVYRKDLWQKIKDKYVILITVRPVEYKTRTLERIKEQLGWNPQEALFSEFPAKAPRVKDHLLKRYVFPKHGADPKLYFAIESNEHTRAMYATYGIEAKHYREYMGIGPAPSGPKPKKHKMDQLFLF